MRLIRFVPALALLVSTVSTLALALILTRELGWFGRSVPSTLPVVDWNVPRDRWIIRPGHETDIFDLVVHGADGAIPKADQPSIAGISPNGGRLEVSFVAYPDTALTIQPAESPGDAFLRTATIATSWSGPSVPEPVRRYVAAIAEAPAWRGIWEPPASEHPTGGRPIGTLGWTIVQCALVTGNVVAGMLLFLGRGRSSTGDTPSANAGASIDPVSALARLAVAMAIGTAIVAAAHLHFRMTDYPYLVRAAHYPSGIAAMPQVLSTMVHYTAGAVLGGGRVWFAVSNLVLLGVAACCWGILLYRAGFPRDAAILGASLYAMGPGTFFLVRWGNGIEHLSATACLMFVLLLTDLAARETARAPTWRYAVIILALCLSVLGVLMKFALMVILPPSCWLWGRWLVRSPASPMHRSLTYLGFAVAVAAPVLLLPPGETSALGFLPSHPALAATGDRLARCAAVVAILSVAAMWKPLRSGDCVATDLAPRRRLMGVPLAVALQSTLAIVRWRIGRLPVLGWALGLFALWFLPFALHAGYEGEAYYGMLASAPLSAAAALLIWTTAVHADVRGWRGFAAAAAACAVLLPATDVRSELARAVSDPADRFAVWIDDVRPLTVSRSPPGRVVVVRTCAAEGPNPPLNDEMEGLYGKFAIWWATGWYDVPIDFRDAAPRARAATAETVTLGYCLGRPPTIEP